MASLQLKPRCVMEELIYPRCYHPKELWKQIEIINQFVPVETNEKFIQSVMEARLPQGAEALFAIPKPKENYARATLDALNIIEGKRRFHCHITIEQKKLRREEKTIKCLDILSKAQKDAGEIIIIPAQFGINHLNKSVDLVRKKMAPNEFGLGAYEVAWMMITHSERQNIMNKVHMDCPGDNYLESYNPYFDYGQKWMELAVRESKRPVHDIGSVTGFVANGRRV
jgi:hypothetical protein